MSMWELVVDIGQWLAAVPGAALLRWAAIERARIRRRWLRLADELDGRGAPFNWCVATTMVAGCV